MSAQLQDPAKPQHPSPSYGILSGLRDTGSTTLLRTTPHFFHAPTNLPMIARIDSTALVCAMLGPATHTVL